MIQNPDQNATHALGNIPHNKNEIQNDEASAFTDACRAQIVYIVGKERLKVDAKDLLRKLILETYVWLNDLSRSNITDIDFPVDKLIEVGVTKKLV